MLSVGGTKTVVAGNPVKLKQTQTHTSEFGTAVWKTWLASASAPANAIDLEEPDLPESVSVRDAAGLGVVLKFMGPES